jgi:histone demethylase
LEQFLIEAQSRKLLSEHLKVEASKNIEGENKPDEVENDKIDVKAIENESKAEDESSKKEEVDEKEEDNKKEEDDSIDIDPKTYCKLGHFHLLLGDYAKGKSNHLNLFCIKV